jgi:integrase
MSDGRGRPRTAVGDVGTINVKPAPGGFIADGYTRTAAGARKRVQAKGATEKEATAALIAKAAKLGVKSTAISNASTLGHLLDSWVDNIVEPRIVLDQTKRMYRTKAARLKGWFGAIELDALTPLRLQTMLYEMAGKKNMYESEYTVLRGVLNRVLSYGVLASVIAANHLSSTEKPPLRSKGDPISLTAEQLQTFRHEFRLYVEEGTRESNRGKAMLLVDVILGLGGLRISEALAIRHCDVDLEASTVDITGTLVYSPGEQMRRQDQPKRERQKRGLDLNPAGMGMKALRAAIALCPDDRRGPNDPVLGRVEPDISAWMNPAIPSLHFDAVTRRPAVVEALAKTDLEPEDISPKTLRATVATLVSRTEGDERAAEMLAHSSVRTTTSHYITPEGKRVQLVTLDALLTM